MWQLIEYIEVSPFPPKRLRRARLYADKDIEDEVVEWLRDQKNNIKAARAP